MKLFATVILILISISSQSRAAECDEFVSWVAPAKDAYFRENRIYPVPQDIQVLAKQYLPQLWVHPESWQPIDFEDYLAKSKLIRKADHKVLKISPSARYLAGSDQEAQCSTYLDADEIIPHNPAPVYIQAFWDQNPADPDERWIFIKYNLVFDWSGLAAEISWLSRLGAWFGGGDQDRWHRLDIHLAAILAFDSQKHLRLLTLAQHNHQQTFQPDVDFPGDQRLQLVAAFRSNELYLDDGRSVPSRHRVVPFFSDVAYLIDPTEKPRFWAIDVAYGRNAGGKEVKLKPIFIEPKHPLADFAGLLGPPRRLMGQYIGRDGPPGFNFYAPPDYVSMANFAAMGYWREGDLELLAELNTFIQDKDDLRTMDWKALVTLMRDRLAHAIRRQNVRNN
jgi:hypothetical protein